MEKKGSNKKHIISVAFAFGVALAFWAIAFAPVTMKDLPIQNTKYERGWNTEFEGSLGSLDSSWSSGNTTILAVWVVNHSEIAETQYDTNDTSGTEVNSSNLILGYAQGDDFNIEVDHTTDFDILVYVRANQTNAAEGGWFNDSWVMVNLTSADLGVSGGVNLSGIITYNASDEAFIYMMFIFNGTDTGTVALKGWNTAMCGTGYSLTRNQIVDDIVFKLQCYY